MPLDFPSGPAINDTWTASNGATYTWDGIKWTVSGSAVGPYLPLAGGTMTGGDITLFRDPTLPLHASPRRYVDNAINLAGNYLGTWAVAANSPNISAGGSISNANYVATTVNPATPEVVPVGVPGIAGLTVANGDRVIWASGLGTWQILRNAGVTLAAADARYVALGGSTMTGALILPGNAGSALQAVPLQQVPIASSTTPAMDGAATIGAGTTWARADHIHPTDTSRASVASVTVAVAAAANNVGRNLIHNSMFNVAQRGAGPWVSADNGKYTLDRWLLYTNTDTISIIPAALNDADRGQIGDEAAEWCIFNTFTGNAAAAASTEIVQRIEKVRRLGGKAVTVSFWARVTSGTATKIGVSYAQVFGSGGSPSAAVLGAGTAVTISSTWTRYSVTMAIASVVGKTLGTAGDDSTQLEFWYSSGTTSATRAGNIGVQSGAIAIWGVQLEIGSVATPFEKPDPQVDLANCQRFYCVTEIGTLQYNLAGGYCSAYGYFPVSMRATPTLGVTPIGTDSNLATISVANATAGAVAFNMAISATANGLVGAQRIISASADL